LANKSWLNSQIVKGNNSLPFSFYFSSPSFYSGCNYPFSGSVFRLHSALFDYPFGFAQGPLRELGVGALRFVEFILTD
jgi:hypothetical protein